MSGKNREREMRLRSAGDAYDPYDGLRAIAKRECAKTGSKTSYSPDFIEFHDVAATSGLSRSILGLNLDAMRKQLAKGVPYTELTDPDMGSVIEYDGRYKLSKAA